jgi:hypothetical protein
MTFKGSTTDLVLPEPPRCAFPACTDWGDHDHHITYDPPITKRLCVRHHEEITIINAQQSRNTDALCPTSTAGGFGINGLRES